IPWARLSTIELAHLLDEGRLAVRRRAMQTLADKGVAAVPALVEVLREGSSDARLNAVWTLTRISDKSARSAALLGLMDRDGNEKVRQAAIHSASIWRDRKALPLLVELFNKSSELFGSSLQNRRAAAE